MVEFGFLLLFVDEEGEEGLYGHGMDSRFVKCGIMSYKV